MTILMKNRNRLALESPQRTVLDSLTGFPLAVALLVLLLATKADAQSVFPCNNDMYILRANPANAAQTLIEKLTIVSNTPTLTSLFTFNYHSTRWLTTMATCTAWTMAARLYTVLMRQEPPSVSALSAVCRRQTRSGRVQQLTAQAIITSSKAPFHRILGSIKFR